RRGRDQPSQARLRARAALDAARRDRQLERRRALLPLFLGLRSLGRARAQPGERASLVAERAHPDALLAREHLDVLVRGANFVRIGEQRHLHAGMRRELLQLIAEDGARIAHPDEDALGAGPARLGEQRGDEALRLFGRLTAEKLRAQVILLELEVVVHPRFLAGILAPRPIACAGENGVAGSTTTSSGASAASRRSSRAPACAA